MEEPLMDTLSTITSASSQMLKCYTKAHEVLKNDQRTFESPYGPAVISDDSSQDALHVTPGLTGAWHLVGHRPRMIKPSTHPAWAPFVEDVHSIAWESNDKRIVDWIVTPKPPYVLRGDCQLDRMMRRVSLQLLEEGWVLYDTLTRGSKLGYAMNLNLYRKDGFDREHALVKINFGPLKRVSLYETLAGTLDKIEPDLTLVN